MVILSDLPCLPADEVIDQLHALFLDSFKQHVFLNRITISAPSSGRITTPYLRLAMACLGTTLSKPRQTLVTGSSQVPTSPEELASNLCWSAVRLWGVMLEIDNREARLIDSILAVSFTSRTVTTPVKRLKERTVSRVRSLPPMQCSPPIRNSGTCPQRRWLAQPPWQGVSGYNTRTYRLLRISLLLK